MSCCILMLHVHVACPCRIYMTHVHVACTCCMSIAAFPCCISIAVCPCCIPLLHVHATTYMYVLHEHAVYYGPHGRVYTACRAKSCDSANSQRQFEKIANFSFLQPQKMEALQMLQSRRMKGCRKGRKCAEFHMRHFANSYCNSSFFGQP
jgi:hypothetical protein